MCVCGCLHTNGKQKSDWFVENVIKSMLYQFTSGIIKIFGSNCYTISHFPCVSIYQTFCAFPVYSVISSLFIWTIFIISHFYFTVTLANLTIYIHIESPSCGIDEMSMWAQHAAFHEAYWPSFDWTGVKQFPPKTNIEMKRALSWTTANASMCRYFHAIRYFSAI